MLKKGIRYKKRGINKDIKEGLMPESTPNINPDDIEIGDEIGPIDREVKEEKQDH